MNARLVCYEGAKITLAFPLSGQQLSIGREGDNQVQLPHEKVSKHHAILRPLKSGWCIEDLKSTNGIVVNGQPVPRAELRHGDRVNIGPYQLRYERKMPEDEWVPSYLMDTSPQTHEETILQTKPPQTR